ncbi:MAG: chemotaxis protein CheD [Spirochaetes bacterium]|nr:chemotaxis protein CheD [Spirochaetota bacterium]MBU0956068.1 chemotaxis protein CheD [Spirochaetota bacterium]
MFNHRISSFEQPVITIHPGEFFVSKEDVVISTVLGSCISVSLFDVRNQLGGINHFMLPGALDTNDILQSGSAKYGMFAIELLYNEMLKNGSRKMDIVAKVFGGGSVLRVSNGSTKIPQSNIDFAFNYLEREKFPIVASDTGGVLPRKIFFFARSGKVLLKRITGSQVYTVEHEEEQYLRSIQRKKTGNVVIFGKPPVEA